MMPHELFSHEKSGIGWNPRQGNCAPPYIPSTKACRYLHQGLCIHLDVLHLLLEHLRVLLQGREDVAQGVDRFLRLGPKMTPEALRRNPNPMSTEQYAKQGVRGGRVF